MTSPLWIKAGRELAFNLVRLEEPTAIFLLHECTYCILYFFSLILKGVNTGCYNVDTANTAETPLPVLPWLNATQCRTGL